MIFSKEKPSLVKVFLIMYNVLMSNVYERDYTHIADGTNYSAGYSLKTDTNYLYERFKIYETEGIVTAAPDAYIEGGVTKKGYVCIDSTIYSDPSFYAKDMLGKKVYLTVNTLVKEKEFPLLYDFLP